MGDAKALARIVETFPTAEHDAIQEKRQMIAEFCRVLGARFSVPKTAVAEPEPHPASHAANQDITGLTRRHQQTLGRLLVGDSEKQIASRLEVSPHTVHVYVKALYRRFEVSSRGELLARFVRTPNSLQVAPASPE
jgi:DNA-binding NarL/FixJ family response regulator